jgi:hypothetical protein
LRARTHKAKFSLLNKQEGMGSAMGTWLRKIGSRALGAVLVLVILPAAYCHAQSTSACMPVNTVSFWDQHPILSPGIWAPGHTYTVWIEGDFPVEAVVENPGGCPDVFISAWEWPDAGNPYDLGPIAPYVTLSNLAYVSPTLATFNVSVAGDAPVGSTNAIVIRAYWQNGAESGYWDYMLFEIENPQPPPGPNPPPPPCGTPVINSVTPDTWLAGQTYPITIDGSGFTSAAMAAANQNCPENQLTVTVPTGTVTLSDVNIIDANTITAVVQPAGTDPEETATLTLWGNYNQGGSDVARANGPPTALAMSNTMATPEDLTPPFPGESAIASANAQVAKPKIALERIDLMDVKATGTPVGGTFGLNPSPITGTANAGIDYASGSNARTNPAVIQLTDPDNPCGISVPCPGGLEVVNVDYAFGSDTASKDFKVPTFGMSCYNLALQKDWGTAPNACLIPTTIHGHRYIGSVTNPYGLSGVYCDAFIHQVILQGSGQLTNGEYVHYDSNTGTIGIVSAVTGSDLTPLVPGQTVARDRAFISRKGVLMDLDQIGNSILANDAGGDIVGYRLDLFGGYGRAACNAYPNPMAVGACTPALLLCPGAPIQ